MKKPAAYYILLPVLTLVACLPLRVLYLLADGLYFLVYYVVGYRRRLVRENLACCFPQLSEAERNDIEKRFYRNFADLIVETVKLLHVSNRTIERHIEFVGIDMIDRLTAQKRDVAVYFSHCGNWEWAPSVTLHTAPDSAVTFCQVYRPLRNKAFNALMLHIRSRFGSKSFAKNTVLRDLIGLRKQGLTGVTGFMSDQKPSHGDTSVVTLFLGRPTAFISGTETLVRRLGMAAIYWDMEKLARGRYRVTCRLLDDGSAASTPGTITLAYASMLEQTIKRNPPIWLWTHNRWKHPVTLP